MNFIRLGFQCIVSAIARTFGFNDRLLQFCDRCGRTRYLGFWASNDVWISVAGNVNSHRHGAYCVPCFDILARRQGIILDWVPVIAEPAKEQGCQS